MALSLAGLAFYVFAVVRYVGSTASAAPASCSFAVAFVLLAEAMVAVAVERNWQRRGGSGTC